MTEIPKSLMGKAFVRSLSGENVNNIQKDYHGNSAIEKSLNAHGDTDGVKEEDKPSLKVNIWIERERRKKMRDMYTVLHDLIPGIPPKLDKASIVDETINYIKNLEQKLSKLKKRKYEKLENMNSREYFIAHQGSSSTFTNNNVLPSGLMTTTGNAPFGFETYYGQNFTLNIFGEEALFNMCWPKTSLGGFTNISDVLEKYNLIVVSVHVSSDSHRSMCMIQARRECMVKTNEMLMEQAIGHMQVAETFQVAEIFKQAAKEILAHLSI